MHINLPVQHVQVVLSVIDTYEHWGSPHEHWNQFHWIWIPDLHGFNMVSRELHVVHRLHPLHCWTGSHAFPRAMDPDQASVEAKWSLNLDPRSRVESPLYNKPYFSSFSLYFPNFQQCYLWVLIEKKLFGLFQEVISVSPIRTNKPHFLLGLTMIFHTLWK